MGLHYAVAAATLAVVSTLGALAQGLLPGQRRGGRVARSLLQVFVTLAQGFAVLIAATAARPRGGVAYVAGAATFAGVFVVVDAAREVAFQVRAPFSGSAFCTLPAAIAVALVAAAQFALAFVLVTLKAPAALDYCGHHLYAFRDAAPFFAAAVYAAWLVHEHIGFTWLARAACCAVARVSDNADDEERDMWVKHKIKAALGIEAALECCQVVAVVATAIFTGVVIEIVAVRRDRCSGVWNAAKLAFPLFAACSGTLAARMAAMRIRDRCTADAS